ncbi:Pal1 cell morphology domain containing protein [Elaphomyces granulatus]
MTLAPMSVPDRKPSPINLNLGSNNPFRNRTVSPSGSSPSSLASPARPDRPLSTNPFLDETEALSQSITRDSISSMAEKSSFSGNAAELFANLSLDPSKKKSRRPPPPYTEKPPSANGTSVSSRRTNERSESVGKDPFETFAEPRPKDSGHSRSDARRPRRNSESSVVDKSKPLDSEEEKRRRERRHRDKQDRSKDAKHRARRPPAHKLDIIDKLDVTGIYGSGLFHHDGPFDACNPHRNRKGIRTAPMQAFPKDSKNMALGGAGPNNRDLDLALFHGHTTEGYTDYAATGNNRLLKQDQPMAFDATTRVEPIHGVESMGLGTSTFLEGTPASRAAIERRQSENEQMFSENGGLQRKKSLAQKFRGINRNGNPNPRMISPETSPRNSGPSEYTQRINDKNPFIQDYDDAYERKGARIQLAEEAHSTGRGRAASSPKRSSGLDRRMTNDRPVAAVGTDEAKNSVGFMNRMKSLRKRPERPDY